MIKLNQKTIDKIKASKPLRLKIQGAINVTHNTILTYLDNADPRLTMLDSLNVIVGELGQPLSEIIDTPLNQLIRQ